MFSKDAFVEAWTNAIVHNDWRRSSPPAVYIYDNRLEIVSSGGLSKNITKEEFFKGTSVPVNNEMMRLFIMLDIVEQNGHGVPIVIKEYGKEAYTFSDNFITVTIPFDKSGFEKNANVGVNAGVNVGVNGDKKIFLSKIEIEILKLIENNCKIITNEIKLAINKNKRTVERNIKKLKDKNIIERIGSDKTGYWKIIIDLENCIK